jgi:hypothetical protein
LFFFRTAVSLYSQPQLFKFLALSSRYRGAARATSSTSALRVGNGEEASAVAGLVIGVECTFY